MIAERKKARTNQNREELGKDNTKHETMGVLPLIGKERQALIQSRENIVDNNVNRRNSLLRVYIS